MASIKAPRLMEAHRIETIVPGDGSVLLAGLPSNAGDAVEVFVLPSSRDERTERSTRRRRQPGSARGMIRMADDFDDLLEDFEPYS